MKHPILFRVVFYGCVFTPCLAIIFLLNLMNYAPFKSSDMRDAYYFGCLYGSRPLTQQLVDNCESVANEFESTLIAIDEQLDSL